MQGKTTVDVPLRDRDDKAEVSAHEELRCLLLAALDALGEVDLLGMGQERGLGDFAQIEPNGIVDEIGVQALEDIEVSFEVDLGFDLPGELRLDLLGHVDLVLDADRFGDEGIDLANVIRLQRIAHQGIAPTGADHTRRAHGHDSRTQVVDLSCAGPRGSR